MRHIKNGCVIIGILFSSIVAAEERASETFSFFTTHEQRMHIDENMIPGYNGTSKKIINLGYVASHNGIRLLLSNGGIVPINQVSINEVYQSRKIMVIDIVKTVE